MEYSRNEILKKLQSALPPKRYYHTLGVEETAIKLAKVYNVDINNASIAALLHDCAKGIPENLTLKFCEEFHIEIEEPKKYFSILHSLLGSEIAKREYYITNEEIIQAIKYHTTGRPNMSMLEKIIFISDYIEPNRLKLPDLDKLRSIAYTNIDRAILINLESTINYLKQSNKPIYPLTIQTRDYFIKIDDTYHNKGGKTID